MKFIKAKLLNSRDHTSQYKWLLIVTNGSCSWRPFIWRLSSRIISIIILTPDYQGTYGEYLDYLTQIYLSNPRQFSEITLYLFLIYSWLIVVSGRRTYEGIVTSWEYVSVEFNLLRDQGLSVSIVKEKRRSLMNDWGVCHVVNADHYGERHLGLKQSESHCMRWPIVRERRNCY